MKEQEIEELRHKNRMEEIETELQAKLKLEKLHHENELERGRIKSAEIRKNIMRKDGY